MLAVPNTGSIKTATVASIISTLNALRARGIDAKFVTRETSDIALSRNFLASRALAEGYSHLLFVDSDMAFKAEAVLKLMDRRTPVSGAIYPKRALDLAALIEAARTEPEPLRSSLQFIVRKPPVLVNVDDFYQVDGIGLGLALIETGALRKLADTGIAKPRNLGLATDFAAFGFFDPIPEGDSLLSEDLAFCHRWRQSGGKVWGLASDQVAHIAEVHLAATFRSTSAR